MGFSDIILTVKDYQSHKVMRMPEGWRILPLENVAEIQTGLSKSASRVGEFVTLPYLRVANVQAGYFDLSEIKKIEVPIDSIERYRVRAGDLLLTEGGDFDKLGRGALWNGQIQECVHQNHVFVVRASKSLLDPRFLAYQTQAPLGRAYFLSCAKQSTNLASINSTQLKQFPTLLAPLPEQRRIADILQTWDEALAHMDRLIKAKERREKALLQELLLGRRRIAGFTERWDNQRLGSLIYPSSRPSPKPTQPFLSAGIRSHGLGVFLKRDFKPTDIALEELFQLRANDLVLNITFAWEGAIAIVPPDAEGALVSHRFPTFELVKERAALGFFRHLIRTPRFIFECGLASPGGAGRNRVLSKETFLKIPVGIPSFEEQIAIGNVLDTCSAELKLLHTLRIAVERQQRGLGQRLLTGRIRVKAA
jgi:type I restriction enzyme S subunit